MFGYFRVVALIVPLTDHKEILFRTVLVLAYIAPIKTPYNNLFYVQASINYIFIRLNVLPDILILK